VLTTSENNNLLDIFTVKDLIEIESKQLTEQSIKQFTEPLLTLSLTSSKKSLSENISGTL
jgi:hypothetical protein